MSEEVTTPTGSNKGKIIIAAVVVALVALYFVITGVFSSQAEAKVVEVIETIELESDGDAIITYDSVESAPFSNSATLNGVQVSSKEQGGMFRAETITILMDGYTENERLPDTFTLSVEKLQIINEQMVNQLSSFSEIDYSEHPMDFEFGYDFSGDKLSSNLTWATTGLSEMSHEMTLSQVSDGWEAIQSAYQENQGSMEFTPAQQQALQVELQKVRFNRTELRYENKGEVELMIKAIANENGVTADELKAQLLAAMDQQLGDSDIAGEIRSFVENPKKLSVTIEPEEPMNMEELTQVSMMLMMGATAEATKALGLTVDAN